MTTFPLTLPMLTIGTSDEHRFFPGTLSLSAETVIRTLTEIGESVSRAGVRKLVIINSHGGNVAAIAIAARDLRVRLGLFVVASSWPRFGYPQGLFTAQERTHGVHAETAKARAGPDLSKTRSESPRAWQR